MVTLPMDSPAGWCVSGPCQGIRYRKRRAPDFGVKGMCIAIRALRRPAIFNELWIRFRAEDAGLGKQNTASVMDADSLHVRRLRECCSQLLQFIAVPREHAILGGRREGFDQGVPAAYQFLFRVRITQQQEIGGQHNCDERGRHDRHENHALSNAPGFQAAFPSGFRSVNCPLT
ncbi:MAG: hypothetical protein M5R42_00525 [Rhodocyclaceae bacterium]|nr:hypothetical protein [Rhodocyclaceae bacterium]